MLYLAAIADVEPLSVRVLIVRPASVDASIASALHGYRAEQELIYVPSPSVVAPHPHGQPLIVRVKGPRS
jgi:hypothetical protein